MLKAQMRIPLPEQNIPKRYEKYLKFSRAGKPKSYDKLHELANQLWDKNKKEDIFELEKIDDPVLNYIFMD